MAEATDAGSDRSCENVPRETPAPVLKLRAWCINPVLSVLVLVELVVFCQTVSPSQPTQPAVTIDLSTLGYLRPTAKRDVRALAFLLDSVAFLDEQTLAVSFFVKNDHPDFTRRDGVPSGPVLFHSAFVDTRTGSVSAQRSWSNNGYWNTFLPMDGGGFFVQANEWISAYSRGLQQLARRRLSYPSDLLPRFELSPSGRTLYGFQDWLEPRSQAWITKIALLDAATLEMKQAQITQLHSDETVSDMQVVYRVSPLHMVLESYSVASSVQAMQVPLRSSETGKLLHDSGCTSMRFVNNSVIAIGGDCPRLILLETKELLPNGLRTDLHFENRRTGGESQPSHDGNRLDFIVSDRNPARAQEGGVEVQVYDLVENRVIFTAEVSPIPQLKVALALSPAGSQLAVISDHTVHIWQLPHPH